jgi:hypothetical protein
MKNIIGWVLIVLGGIIIIILRVKGGDLPEGRLLVTYLPYWAFSFALLFLGSVFIDFTKENKGDKR